MCEFSWNAPLFRQIWTVSGVLLGITAQGMEQGYMSVLLSALQKPDASIKIDLNLASWLASGMAMSILIGVGSATFLMEIWGRKIAYMLELLPSIIALLLVYFSTNFFTLMAARVLDGVTAGGIVVLAAVVIGEYTDPCYRAMFLNLKTACICLGTTIIHGLGYYIYWRTAALANLVPPIIALVMVFTWVESPTWLASKKRFDECERSFLWLRGDTEQSRKELKRLMRSQEIKPIDTRTICDKIKGIFKKFIKKDFLKPVIILATSFVLLEASGRHILAAYANDIVKSIIGKDDRSSSFYYTMAIDLIVTVSSTFSSVLIKFMKIRTLLFSSGISSLIVLGNACLYLFLVSQGVVSKEMTWIPVSMFIVYFILVNLGCTTIPLALIGELIPLEHKSTGIFASSLWSSIAVVVTLKIFPYMMVSIKIYGTFAVLGCVMIVILIVLYFILPETKGRTLQEIEDCFKNGNEFPIDDEESYKKMLHSSNT